MTLLYKILDIILISVYVICFIKVKQSRYIFSPIYGFLIGITFFILFPFSMLTFVGNFSLNPLSGARGEWASVNLSENSFIYPYLVIWTILLMCGLIMTIIFSKDALYKNKGLNPNKFYINKGLYKRIVFILICSMSVQIYDWVSIIIKFGGISNYLGYHWYMRNDLLFNTHGGSYILLTKIFHSNKMIFTSAGVLYTLAFFSRGSKFFSRPSMFLGLIICFHLLIILLSGNRIYFALYLLLTVSGFFIFNLKKPLMGITLSFPILVFVFSAWSYTRSTLTDFGEAFEGYIENLKDMNNGVISMFFDISEGSNMLVTFHIINDYGKVFDYLNGATYFKVFAPLLPDFIKNIDSFTVIVGTNYMPGNNLSLNSTIISEVYANFGLWILIVLPLICLLLICISNKLNFYQNPIFSVVTSSIVCWFVRSVFSDNLIGLVIAMSILFCELLIYNFFDELYNSRNFRRKKSYAK